MNKLKRAYYAFMYEVTDNIMWLTINDSDRSRTNWNYWWNVSEGFRKKRESVA